MRNVPERLRPRDYEPLRRLYRAGVARKADVRGVHEPRDGHPGGRRFDSYYLDKSGGDALLMGGFSAEIEDALEATSNWRLHQVPARVEHAYFRTEFLLRVMEDLRAENERRAALDPMEAVRSGQVVAPLGSIDPDGVYGESHPDYPLFGEKSAAAKPPPGGWRGMKGHEWTCPDGRLEIEFFPYKVLGACPFDVEVEYKSRRKLPEKVEKRAGWMRRLLDGRVERRVTAAVGREEAKVRAAEKQWTEEKASRAAKVARASLPFPGLPDEVCPVVFLYPTRKKAMGMRDRLRRAIEEGGLPRYCALDADLRRYRRLLGWMFVFAGWDDIRPRVVAERKVERGGKTATVEEREPHGHSLERVYMTLADYAPADGGGDGVDLRTVADYRRNLIGKVDARSGGGR